MSDPLSDLSMRRVARLGGLAILVAGVALMGIVVFPQLVGADHSYVVVSGSMSPTIEAGDVVMVRNAPAESIAVGDVITYETVDAEPGRTTHRVVDVAESDGELQFRTKGDANEEPDSNPVPEDRLIGRVLFHVPYLGYLLSFAGSKLGILSLVVVPSALLVVTEAYSLGRALLNDSEGGGTEDAVEEPEHDPTEGSQ